MKIRSSVPFLGRGVPSQINGRMNILTTVPILLIRGMRKACMKTLIGKGLWMYVDLVENL